MRDLADCLIKMGARIEGAGTVTIQSPASSGFAAHITRVLPDRIEAGTYAMAVAAAGGDVVLEGARPGFCNRRSTHLRVRRHIDATNAGIRVAATAPDSRRSTSAQRRSRAFRPTCRRSSWR